MTAAAAAPIQAARLDVRSRAIIITTAPAVNSQRQGLARPANSPAVVARPTTRNAPSTSGWPNVDPTRPSGIWTQSIQSSPSRWISA